MRTYYGATEPELMGIADEISGMNADQQTAYFRQNPELMGFLPFLAAIPGLLKGAFKVGKNLVGLIKGKKKAPSPPPPPPPSPMEKMKGMFKNPMVLAGIGGGALLLILMSGKRR